MKSKKKTDTPNANKTLAIEEVDFSGDFGGIPSDISLTKNIGCAADSKPKEKQQKWKNAE